MATAKDTVDFILTKLRHSDRFTAKAMFGEYALYVDGKVVALICDDRLYVKIVPASSELEMECEKGEPYKGAKPYYIVDEALLSRMDRVPLILFAVADSLPAKPKRSKSKKK
jgi:TfoX/Sxy family transcriptional regulator of competence genes